MSVFIVSSFELCTVKYHRLNSDHLSFLEQIKSLLETNYILNSVSFPQVKGSKVQGKLSHVTETCNCTIDVTVQ